MEDGPSHSFTRKLKGFFRRFRNGRTAERFEEEIQDLTEQGVLSPNEGEMIHSIFEFGETVAREIMVPRTSVVAATSDASIGEVIELIMKNGHTRLPIFEGDVDHVVGILIAKDLLTYWDLPSDQLLPHEILRPAVFVPEGKKIVDLLAELRMKKSHMAVVLDEYGGTAGIVTLEDIIEEIIGDIRDEYDAEDESITRLDENTILVNAQMNLYDLEEQADIALPEGEYETLGGFVTDMAGRVPQENEQIQFRDLMFTIRSGDERKIKTVEIRKIPPGEIEPDIA